MVCGSFSQCAHDDDKDEDIPDVSDPGDLTRGVAANNDPDTCDMVSNRPIEPRCQIFNTYGETLTTAQLLARYGFALDGNDNDVVSWELSELETPQNMDRDFFMWLVDQVIRIWPRFTGWRESHLVYQPTTAFGAGKLEGSVRHRPILCVNSDAKISHHLWIYCALLATANELGYLLEVDEMLEFLDRVATSQIYRETNAGGSEEEGGDAVHSMAKRTEQVTSRVSTDASEDPVMEEVSPGVVCVPGGGVMRWLCRAIEGS